MSPYSDNATLDLVCGGLAPIRVSEAMFGQLSQVFHVPDVSAVMPGMQGKGVKVAGLLELATFPIEADHVTFISQNGQYSASLTINQAREYGILVYEIDGQPLPPHKGGPFRLVTPGLGDLCANVKNIGMIKVSAGPGKDTRPEERSC